MSIYITKDGEKRKVNISATDVQLLDIDGRFKNKNLEDALKEVGSGTEENMTRIEEKVEQLSNSNLLINGDFSVWQRGTSFNTNGYTADRWIYDVEGDDKGKITRHSNGGVQIKLISNKRFWFMQKIELNQELKHIISNKTVILSFEVSTSSDVEINPYARIWSPSKNENIFLQSYTANATKKQIECKITLGDLSADEWLGIDIFRIEDDNKFTVGSDLYIRFENVKLELGSVSTPFIPRLYGEELALCQRYYRNYDVDLVASNFYGYAHDATSLSITMNFDTPMRIIPTFTLKNNNIRRNSNGEILTLSSFSQHISPYGLGTMYLIQADKSLVVGQMYSLSGTFDAEIY